MFWDPARQGSAVPSYSAFRCAHRRSQKADAFGVHRACMGPVGIESAVEDALTSISLLDAEPCVHAHTPPGDLERGRDLWPRVLPVGST